MARAGRCPRSGIVVVYVVGYATPSSSGSVHEASKLSVQGGVPAVVVVAAAAAAAAAAEASGVPPVAPGMWSC